MDEGLLQGCLTGLTDVQVQAFSDFKALCEENDLYWPRSKLEDLQQQRSNSDYTLLRFLRARSYDPRAAYIQYKATIAWRIKVNIDEAYDNVEIENFNSMWRLQPQWIGRRDKNGFPVMVYVMSAIRPEDIKKSVDLDPLLTTVFLPAEYVTEFVIPLCKKLRQDHDISATCNIVDLSHVGLRGFWNLRSLLQAVSSMATAHYPESVERIFVIGAPSFFPTVWKLITRWFEPATTRKISILSKSEVKSTMNKYIATFNIPERFGGSLKWDFNEPPAMDEEAAKEAGNLATNWVHGPIRYTSEKDYDKIMAVGKDGANMRRTVLATTKHHDG